MAAGRGAGSERAVAVVLFTDLVGSTELRARVGEEAAEELRRAHDRLLTQAVEANNGRVVKGLGDGIMATFAGASDAVAAAVAIQQGIDRLNRSGKAPVPLAVRVGLSAGDVSFEDDDVHGTPVIEAARLCAAAEGGEVLAFEMVRWLARGATAAFTSVGEVDLKGLPEPVPAVRIGWEPLPTSAIPMPNLLTDVGRIFVGRDAELERLSQLWKEAAAGERRVALLAGEPGVGKTRLAAELAARVHEEGATVLAGRCDEDLGVPYQPFVEALRHFMDQTPPGQLPERLGRYGGELARLVPEVTESLPDLAPPLKSDPETERYRLFDAVAAWLGAVCTDEPVLLVLDDLQWAAKPTLLLLRHVARAPDVKRVLVVGTYRDTEIGHDHPLVEVVADLRRQGGGVERISLTGLDASGVTAFMEQAAGHTLDDEDLALARAVHEETEGNPFFVREVFRHLIETGAIERREGRWTTRLPVEELGIPESVRDVIGRRLARLSQEANQTLRMAAVVGPEFELRILEAAGSLEDEVVLSSLEEATEARLVIEAPDVLPRYRFAHALVRDTLYGEVSAARRTTMHRRVAEAIEALHPSTLDDHLPALAYHWARGSAPAAETSKAVDYATRAGHRALAQLAHDEAVAYYRQALELLAAAPDEPLQLDLLISLGEAQRRAGDPSHRETLLEAARLARQRDDNDALSRAVLANTRGFLYTRTGAVDAEKVAMLEAALVAIGDQNLRTRARLLAILGLELLFADPRRSLTLSDEALGLARTLDDPETLASILLARFFPAHVPDLLEERLANTAELLSAVEPASDPALAADAHLLRARALLEVGDVHEGDRCLQVAERLSAGLGQPALRYRVVYVLTGWAITAGRFAEAEQLLVESRALGHGVQVEADYIFAMQQWRLRLEQGRLDEEAVALLEAAARDFDVPLNDSMVALAACEIGRETDARAALARQASTPAPFDCYWLLATTNWAAVAVHLRERTHAESLLALLEPYEAQAVPLIAVPTPSVAHHLGLLAATLGRYDQAERWFGSAAGLHQRLGAPTWLARTRLEWARMFLTRHQPGDSERARELLGQALATARELGVGDVECRAVALLQECP